ncbi:helix-turn-helix transcriptional regulator [Muricauda sp. CAU 1633]|nr:helix-turn-helix transcriptional regulator [Muricauda sp. CAU 1633]
MDLHKFEDNPNVFFEPNPHITDFFEIFVFEQGNGTIELNGHYLEVDRFTLFFTSPYQKKSCRINRNSVKGFHLVFQNDFLANFFEDKLFVYRLQYFYNALHPQYLQLSPSEYQLIQTLFNEIVIEIQNFQKDSLHLIRPLLYFALSKLNRMYSKAYKLSHETHSEPNIYRFKEALEMHIRKHHAVDDYCRLLNMTRHQLNQVTRAYFGHTSKEVIQFRLLQEVQMELRYSNRTISEIAHNLQFSDPNNLTRFFTRLTGQSPRKYRLNYQNDRYL